jgi:hypothetical protein
MLDKDNQRAINELVDSLGGHTDEAVPTKNGHHASVAGQSVLTDQDVLGILFNEVDKGLQWKDVYDGNFEPYYPSASEAVGALLLKLAFYTGKDPIQMERLIRGSALASTKFDERRKDTSWVLREITRAIEKTGDPYNPSRLILNHSKASENGNGAPSSPSSPYSSYDGDDGARAPLNLSLTRFASVERPSNERPMIIEGAIPQRFPSILYGDGGTAKSMLAASMLLDVSRGAETWMGKKVSKHGPVVYLDFELDLEEQSRRVYQLTEGEGLEKPPDDFYYLSGADHPVGPFLQEALRLAKEAGAVVVLLDSLGFALEGDAEASRDVLRFIRKYIKPFETAGIALVIVDHQSKLSPGESYHQKTPFGSVYKSNSCRSVIQVGVEDQREGELTVRLRHTKANFGGKFDPFNVRLLFHETKLEMHYQPLSATELVTDGSLNTKQKIRRLLAEGPAFPDDLAEEIGVGVGAVKNSLTALRKASEIEDTGATSESGARQVRLINFPSSPSLSYRADDGDDGGQSLTTRVVNVKSDEPYDVYIGRANSRLGLKQSDWHNPFVEGKDGSREEVVEKFEEYLLEDPHLVARLPEIRGQVLGCHCAPKPCHGDVLARLADLQEFLADPPEWFTDQARGILEDHTTLPDWTLDELASAVANEIPNVHEGEQALPLVRAKLEEMHS